MALFLLGALVFLRFVVFAPSAIGSAGTSFLPFQKAFPEAGLALFGGTAPVILSAKTVVNLSPDIVLLSGSPDSRSAALSL